MRPHGASLWVVVPPTRSLLQALFCCAESQLPLQRSCGCFCTLVTGEAPWGLCEEDANTQMVMIWRYGLLHAFKQDQHFQRNLVSCRALTAKSRFGLHKLVRVEFWFDAASHGYFRGTIFLHLILRLKVWKRITEGEKRVYDFLLRKRQCQQKWAPAGLRHRRSA